jgi:membrane protein
MSSGLFDLQGVSAKEIAKRTWNEIRRNDVFGRSAQLAYYLFFALFPFLICIIASLSVFGRADRGRAVLFALFARFLPAPAFQLISGTLDVILRTGGPLKMSLGIVVSVWSSSMGMSAVMDTLNATYHVREGRSLVKQYLIAVALTLASALLLVMAIVIVLFGDSIVAHDRGWIAVFLWRAAEWLLSLAVLFFILALTYHFAPDLKRKKWRWITPGAVLGVVLWILMSAGLRIYLRESGDSIIYGSLGAVIVLLLCFYLGGMAVLSGGALNGVLETLDHRSPRVSSAKSSRHEEKKAA